jgi:DNA-binding response OmpR family regulator
MQRILIVDDEPAITGLIRERLEREGLAVITASRAEEALAALSAEPFDLLILDIGLPDVDGFVALRRLREQGHDLPVLIVTARGDEIDRVVGLELGADDYMVKPFSVRELAARVRAMLRRSAEVSRLRAQVAQAPPAAPLASADLQIDSARRRALFRGTALDLRPREFELLALLAANPGRVYTREALLRQLWGHDDYVDLRTVDVHVRRLRAKLAAIDPEAQLIQTEWGVGYRFVEG